MPKPNTASADVIDFDECDCRSPAREPVVHRLPDGTTFEIVGCVNCGGAVEWSIEKPSPKSAPADKVEELQEHLKRERAKNAHLKVQLPKFGNQRKDPLEDIDIDRLLSHLPESRNFITAPDINPNTLVRGNVALSSPPSHTSSRFRTGHPGRCFHLLYQDMDGGGVVQKVLCREKHLSNADIVDAASEDLRDMRLCKDCLGKKLALIDKRNIAEGAKEQAIQRYFESTVR